MCAYSPTKTSSGIHSIPHQGRILYTAAHRSLPLNSLVNVDTGTNSIAVKITSHRTNSSHMLNLSTRAAKSLHIDSDNPVRCTMTVMHMGRGDHRRYHLARNNRSCKSTWFHTCYSSAECCEGRCVRVPGGTSICIPRHARLRLMASSHAERTV